MMRSPNEGIYTLTLNPSKSRGPEAECPGQAGRMAIRKAQGCRPTGRACAAQAPQGGPQEDHGSTSSHPSLQAVVDVDALFWILIQLDNRMNGAMILGLAW